MELIPSVLESQEKIAELKSRVARPFICQCSLIFILPFMYFIVRITTDSPANEGGRLGPEGRAWSVTGAAFAQAKGVTAEARRVESIVRITTLADTNHAAIFSRRDSYGVFPLWAA